MTFLPLTVENLVHTFETTKAVQGVSLNICEGEIFGLIGPDGAGKTTTMRAMAGLIDPTGGTVLVYGKDPRDHKSGVRERLGYMPQRYSLYGDLSVAENLRFFGSLFCLGQKEFEGRTKRLLAITHLEPFRDRRADALSGGMYKKLALSCALLHQPKVLLLDEPTNGVDPISRIELWDLLYTFLAEGMAVAVSTSYMDEAARCTRVGVIHEGKILLNGRPEELVRDIPAQVVTAAATTEQVEASLGFDLDNLGIISATPRGHTTRLVIESKHMSRVISELGRKQISSTSSTPGFEDLFLATLAQQKTKAAVHG